MVTYMHSLSWRHNTRAGSGHGHKLAQLIKVLVQSRQGKSLRGCDCGDRCRTRIEMHGHARTARGPPGRERRFQKVDELSGCADYAKVNRHCVCKPIWAMTRRAPIPASTIDATFPLEVLDILQSGTTVEGRAQICLTASSIS
jgi:hypothetical protein